MSARLRAFVAGGLAFAGIAGTARAEEKIVELPPLVVMETAQTPPWLYLKTDYGEYLSRCTNATTREFITADLRQFRMLRAFVPDSLLVKMDMPSLVLLDRLELKPAGDALLQDMFSAQSELQAAQRAPTLAAPAPPPNRMRALLNLRIDDRDMNGLFAYLDEKTYDGDKMVLTPNYVRFMLERRVPDLPGWFVEAAVAVFSDASFVEQPITVRPFLWISSRETNAVLRNPDFPRALLPMGEMFSSDVLRGEGDRAPERRDAFYSQIALFFRWGVDPRNGMRDAFFKLVERASREAMNEEIFEECFGFGYAEMRDRLSDYLPIAVKESFRIDPGSTSRPRLAEVRLATKEQIARLLGEWERLEVFYVRGKHPEFVDRYIQEARRTLRKGYDLGDRDPVLLAALGLCEVDSGNESGAPFFLNRAVSANVVRPRAHYETARLLFRALMRMQGPEGKLSAAEAEQIVAPLRTAIGQAPLLPEAVALFAGTWLRSAGTPPASDLAALARACRNFPARPALTYTVAVLHARNGQPTVAQELVAGTLRYPLEESLRSRFLELQNILTTARK